MKNDIWELRRNDSIMNIAWIFMALLNGEVLKAFFPSPLPSLTRLGFHYIQTSARIRFYGRIHINKKKTSSNGISLAVQIDNYYRYH
jgi:hypothetical protein